MSIYLGVNIDHVATLRQARDNILYPDPVHAALMAESAGADGITVHLREDRRHIQERDLKLLVKILQTRLNFEMAVTEEMLNIALEIRPTYCCFVPEKREELTTEGGLNVVKNFEKIKQYTQILQSNHIQVSLFIDPAETQIRAAKETGAKLIELHTGAYAKETLHKHDNSACEIELKKIKNSAKLGAQLGLIINAGHGLTYHNVSAIAKISEIHELNIGHSIVSAALFEGFEKAVSKMKRLIVEARRSE